MMTRLPFLALAAVLAAAPVASAGRPPDPHAVARAVVDKLLAARSPAPAATPRPQALDTTDFAGTHIGCITLARWEMRQLGYPGHAFACEEVATGELLGALLTQRGAVLRHLGQPCHITGQYTGDQCYDMSICGVSDRLCKR